MKKVGRNDPCPCGSGKKYKKCCLSKDEAAARQAAARQAAIARAAPIEDEQPGYAGPPLPDTFEPEPRSPEEDTYDGLWEEFQASDPDQLPDLFRHSLSEVKLDDDFVYELLSALRKNDQRAMAGALLDELRAARPDIYQQSAPYYLEWQINDAISAGRTDLLPELTAALAETAGDELDIFYVSHDRLAYHGHLDLIAKMMRQAWPLVQVSNKFIPGADDEFAADAQQLTLLAFLDRQGSPRADDPELVAALEFFAPIEAELLGEQIALLSGEDDHPISHADHSEDEQMNRLGLCFQGEVYRKEGVPLSRAELARSGLMNYIGERRDAQRQGRPRDHKDAIGAPRLANTKTAAALLCPDRKSLDHFLAHHLTLLSNQFYQAAATLELTPAWLRFLQNQGLITPAQRSAALADLRGLVADAAPIWEHHRSDPTVASNIRDAWEGA